MKLFSSAAGFSAGTMFSRVLGAGRDILLGIALGVSQASEVYVLATKVPNLLRQLFSDGAVNGSIVPSLCAADVRGGGQQHRRSSGEIVMLCLVMLLIALALMQLFLREIILVLAPGFADAPLKVEQAVKLSRITCNFLVLSGTTAALAAVVISNGRLYAAGLAPAILNVVLVAILVYGLWQNWESQLLFSETLSWGFLVAGALQVLVLWAVAQRHGLISFRFSWRWRNISPETKLALRRIGPTMLGAGVGSLKVIIGGMAATYFAGALVVIYYASRIIFLPQSIIGVALANAVLAPLSRSLKLRRTDDAASTLADAVMLASLLSIPAAFGLAAAAEVVVVNLFGYRNFDAEAVRRTTDVIQISCFALPAAVVTMVYAQALFALGKVQLIIYSALISLIVFVASLLLLLPYMQYLAIPVATVVSTVLQLVINMFLVRRTGLLQISRANRKIILLSLVASLAMTAGILQVVSTGWSVRVVGSGFSASSLLELMLLVVGAAGFYAVTVFALCGSERGHLKQLFFRAESDEPGSNRPEHVKSPSSSEP